MKLAPLLGKYSSNYEMASDSSMEIVSDLITFYPSPDGKKNKIIGIGDVDPDGHIMTLELQVRGLCLRGIWQELAASDGSVVYEGAVELKPHNQMLLTGSWSSEIDPAQVEGGVWILFKDPNIQD